MGIHMDFHSFTLRVTFCSIINIPHLIEPEPPALEAWSLQLDPREFSMNFLTDKYLGLKKKILQKLLLYTF